MRKFAAFAGAVLVLLTVSGCEPKISPIAEQDIKDVAVYTHEVSRPLTEDEISEFVRLYNSASYGGKKTGEGGTPDFWLCFTLTSSDETVVLNDFYGKIEPYNADRYIESKELYELIKRLSETI